MTEEIRILEDAGAVEQVKVRKAALAKLTGNKDKEKEETKSMQEEGVFDTGLTPDEYDGVDTGVSKRPAVGDHEAEMQMPEDYSEKAYKFPFVITEDGPWKGFDEDAFYPIKQPHKTSDDRIFSPIKNLAVACGIEPKTVKGKITFSLADFAGKKFCAVYVETPYELERDGQVFKGTQSKVKRAKPLAEKVETLT